MDLRDTPEQALFRARLRTWLEANVPLEPEPASLADRWPYMLEFQQRLYDGGWVALSYPEEFGGQGLGAVEEAILSEELGRAQAPTLLPLGHLARPLLSHGSDEQRRRYLPALLASTEIWCQGFSEPEAGSDLASLRTRAEFTGREWLINGHKIWTSYGAFADYCLLLARTDPEASRHNGISAFLVPLNSPGVTVRAIVLANGDEEFAEIQLDDVRIPAENIIGEPGDGWQIAMDVVNYERGAVETGYLPKFERYLSELARYLSNDASLATDRHTLKTIGEVSAMIEVLRMHCLRSLSDRAAGHPPGPEASIGKLLMTAVEQKLANASLNLLTDETTADRAGWFDRYLYARAASIYGGSTEIQRNILAERMLGLPRVAR